MLGINTSIKTMRKFKLKKKKLEKSRKNEKEQMTTLVRKNLSIPCVGF